MKNDNPQTKLLREFLKMKEAECRYKNDKFGSELYRLFRKTFFS